MDPLGVFETAAAIGGLAGIASLLQSPAVVTIRNLCSSILYGSLSSLLTAMAAHDYAKEYIYGLLAISGFVGFGGAKWIDTILNIVTKIANKLGDKWLAK
jgi:hypothetical protein